MKKTKFVTQDKYTFSSYWKSVGNGYEVGFEYGKEVIFVGNFIHQNEATQWYRIMNREIREFSRQYAVGAKFPFAWYCNFLKSHLYKCYYGYLDSIFTRYNRDYKKAVANYQNRYRTIAKKWDRRDPFFKKVA